MILLSSFWTKTGLLFLYEKNSTGSSSSNTRRNNNRAFAQPLTNAVLNQWLACCSLIEMPPRNKQCKQNRNNSIFLGEKKLPSLYFYCQSLLLSPYLGLPYFGHFSLSHSMPLVLFMWAQWGTVFLLLLQWLSLSFYYFIFLWLLNLHQSLIFIGQKLAPLPYAVKVFSCDSERGKHLCIKHEFPESSASSSKLRKNLCLQFYVLWKH